MDIKWVFRFMRVQFYWYSSIKMLLDVIMLYNDHKVGVQFYWYSSIKIFLVGRVLANGPGDLGSIPGRVIQKTQKMVLDIPLA